MNGIMDVVNAHIIKLSLGKDRLIVKHVLGKMLIGQSRNPNI